MAIWVLIDDRAGNTSQALGVAECLGLPFETVDVAYSGGARLPNVLRGASLLGVTAETRARLISAVADGIPSLVIAAGRRTAPIARWIKRQASMRRQSCALCQIMDPGSAGRAEFDVVAVPKHDRKMPKGPNILPIEGSPHRVTAARLDIEKAAWADRLAKVCAPRIAVLVGGKTKAHDFTPARASVLGGAVADLAQALGGQAMVTTSRRTGKAAEDALFTALPDNVWRYRWGDAGENPYFGFLAWADVIVVTGDSMSMASEACGTHKPVIIESPEGQVSAKHARLHRGLVQSNRAMLLEADAAAMVAQLRQLTCTPTNAAEDVVAALRQLDLLPQV